MPRIIWQDGELRAMGEWLDKNNIHGEINQVRAAQAAVLVPARQRTIGSNRIASDALNEIRRVMGKTSRPAEPVKEVKKDPTIFSVAELMKIAHLLNPAVQLQVLS